MERLYDVARSVDVPTTGELGTGRRRLEKLGT